MDIVMRATVVYFLLFALLRAVGRRELAELTPFDLVVLIVIGDLVQQGTTQEDMSLTGASLAAGTMCLWMVTLSYVTYRFRGTRGAIKGNPVLVVKDGEALEAPMRSHRIDVDYLCDAARQQGIGSLDEVRWGVLEADGMISFIRKERSDSHA